MKGGMGGGQGMRGGWVKGGNVATSPNKVEPMQESEEESVAYALTTERHSAQGR